MSHRSSVPSGAAPVILKGHVHLSQQWIKKHPQAGIKGPESATAERTKKKQHLLWKSGFQREASFKGRRSKMAAACHSLTFGQAQGTWDSWVGPHETTTGDFQRSFNERTSWGMAFSGIYLVNGARSFEFQILIFFSGVRMFFSCLCVFMETLISSHSPVGTEQVI